MRDKDMEMCIRIATELAGWPEKDWNERLAAYHNLNLSDEQRKLIKKCVAEENAEFSVENRRDLRSRFGKFFKQLPEEYQNWLLNSVRANAFAHEVQDVLWKEKQRRGINAEYANMREVPSEYDAETGADE